MSRVYEIHLMCTVPVLSTVIKHCASLGEACVSTVHSPVKRLLVRGEWMKGGDGK